MCYRWSWVMSARKYSEVYLISPVSVLFHFLIRANSFSACAVLYLVCRSGGTADVEKAHSGSADSHLGSCSECMRQPARSRAVGYSSWVRKCGSLTSRLHSC